MEPRVHERDASGKADASHHAQRCLLLLVAVAAGGCATTTAKAVAPPVAVPGAWQGAGGEAAAQPAGDLSRWWETLGDKTLTELVERALVANPDLRTAQSRLRQARAQRGLARIDLLPSIDGAVTAGTSKTTGTSPQESYTAGLDASWEVDVFGATRKAVSAAQADVEASEASLHNTQVSLAAEVALGYVQLRSYQARLAIARGSLARQEETLDLTRWRAQAGLTSELDVEQSRANAEQTRAQIPSLETALAQTEHALATLVGQPPATLHDLLASEGSIPTIPDTVAVGIPADALRQRPDVRAAERQLVAAIARVGEAKAARFPTFRLSGTLGASGPSVGDLLSAETVARSLLGSLTAPIFYRGRIRRQIEIQSEAQEQALVGYESTVLSALEEVENAIVSLGNARRRRVSLAAAVEASRVAAELARQRYSAGLANYQTVLDTERTVLSAEDSLESSKAEGAQALVQLYKALGGGWTPAAIAEATTRPQSEES
jgi:NodT family efflux transporter outer membrane factor (OMF) lipoprotein